MSKRKIGVIALACLCVSLLSGAIGASFLDFSLRTAPSNPASGFARTYVDSGTNLFTCLLSSGASCLPTSNYADNEVPSGTINGTNLAFTVAHTVNPAASLQLYLNGVLQMQGRDYTLSGTTITYTVAPNISEGGDWHVCWYRY